MVSQSHARPHSLIRTTFMKLAPVLLLTVAAGGMLLTSTASAQDSRTVLLRFRKAGDTTVVIRNAEIRVDHTIDVVTDSAGIVRIPDLEDGGHIVEAVAKGYEGYFDNFVSGEGGPVPIDLELRAYIEPPKPKTEPTSLERSGFDQRRALGQGKFFTLAQLTAADGRPLANFLKVEAGATIASGPRNESYVASSASSPAQPCYAAVVRDGLRIYPVESVSPPDLDKIFTDNLGSVEFYPTSSPAGLGMTSKCGTLVLWGRHP